MRKMQNDMTIYVENRRNPCRRQHPEVQQHDVEEEEEAEEAGAPQDAACLQPEAVQGLGGRSEARAPWLQGDRDPEYGLTGGWMTLNDPRGGV